MAAVRTVEQLSSDPEFQGYYDLEEAHLQEFEDVKETYKEIYLEEGIEKGIEQGTKEANIETAKKFLKMGILTDEQIAKCTDLTLEEVNELKTE